MAYSSVQYLGDGSNTIFTVPFQYLDKAHVVVKVAGSPVGYSWLSASSVQVAPAPSGIVEIRRLTPKDSPPVDFSDGAVLKEKDLDLLAIFSLYCAQETADASSEAIAQSSLGIALAKVYQGTLSANPSVRSNGQPLEIGDLYFNSVAKTMRVYTGLLWQDIGITVPGILKKPATPVVASAGQTSFAVAGGFDPQGIIVFVNGSMIAPPDVDFSSGASIVFATPLDGGEEVSWLAFGVFQVADSATKAELLLPAGAGLVGFSHDSTYAAGTLGAKAKQQINVKDKPFQAKGDGVADDTAAIQAALNGTGVVRIPAGTYKITSQLVVGPNCTGIVGDGMYSSLISKAFNGNAILCDTNGAMLVDFGIEGGGATYSGGGIVPRGYNINILRVRAVNTQDSPILVAGAVGSNALAATYLRVDSCILMPTNSATTYAIRAISADDPTRPTARVFTNISGGSSLVDFSGMNYAVLRDSLGTSVKFDVNSSKVMMHGNRITSAGADVVIFGSDHIIDGNFWGFGGTYNVHVAYSAADVFFGPSNLIVNGNGFMQAVGLNVLTGDPNPNNISTQLRSFPLNWFAATLNPAIGNGTALGYYKQEGRLCHASFIINAGTTTSVGTGAWYWTLPFKAHVTAVGHAVVKSQDGTYYSAAVEVQGGSSSAVIYLNGASAPLGSSSLNFGSGAVLEATITFLIAPA